MTGPTAPMGLFEPPAGSAGGACRWSVVIPAYNEAARLPRYLREVVDYFDGRNEPYEVLVVDDGSSDGTATCVRDMGRAHASIGLLVCPDNRGKGRAVCAGMTRARGALRLMADADGATPIAEVKRLEVAIESGADLAVGSRARPDASVVRQTRFHRRAMGNVFNWIVRRLGVGDIRDTQCGFKLFRGEVAADLFTELRGDGYGFDVELLLRARRRRYHIVEVPVNWADQPGSKVGVLWHGPRMLGEILCARWRLRAHRHPRRTP